MTRGCRLMGSAETSRTGLGQTRLIAALRWAEVDVCPRLIRPEPIALSRGKFLRDRGALGADSRVGRHLRSGLFKGLGPLPRDEVTQGNQDQVALKFRGRYGEHVAHQVARQSGVPAHCLEFLIRHGLLSDRLAHL